MDSVLGLVVFGSIAAGGVYYCQKSGGKSSKGGKKSSSTTPAQDNTTVEDIDDFLPLKKKKQAPIITKLPEKPKKEKKVQDVQQDKVPQQQPQPQQSKKEKKAAAVEVVVPATTPKKEEKKAVEAPRKLTEIELLKQRIADLESSKSAAAAAAAPAQPMSNKQAKKAAKAAAAETSTSETAKKDDKKGKEHNPAPQMTEDQKKEQEQALAQFQREQSQWREIPQDNRIKNKKSKDKHNYVDLSVLTIQSSVNAKFGDRRALIYSDDFSTDAKSGDESPKNKSSPIEQISKVTGCKIDLQQRPTKEIMDKSPNKGADLPMKIDFEGTQDQIDLARSIINDLITKGFSTKLTPNMTDAKLRVDPSDHFHIVGKSGANIIKIMDATGARITVPQRAKEGQQQDDIVRIVGSADGVQAAREAIKSLITNGYSDLTHENWTKSVIPYPASFRRYILQGGANSLIRTVETNSTCKLNLPTEQTDNTLTIVGPADKVQQAAADIKAVLQKLEAPVNDVFLVGFDSNDFKANELW